MISTTPTSEMMVENVSSIFSSVSFPKSPASNLESAERSLELLSEDMN